VGKVVRIDKGLKRLKRMTKMHDDKKKKEGW
jgi:hypothetical protein